MNNILALFELIKKYFRQFTSRESTSSKFISIVDTCIYDDILSLQQLTQNKSRREEETEINYSVNTNYY